MYVEVELFPDSPTHDALGLTRVHNTIADPLVTGTASAPLEPVSSPKNYATIAVGPQWTVGDVTQRLSGFTYSEVLSTNVTTSGQTVSAELVQFSVTYNLQGADVAFVREDYR